MTPISQPQKSNPQDYSLDYFPPLQRVILVALQSQNTVAQIAMVTDKKKQNVYKALKKLETNGFVERAGLSYILSGRGHVVLQKRASSSIDTPLVRITSSSSVDEKVSQPVEAHKISFNVLLWSVPEGWGRWLNTCCGLHLPEEHDFFPRDLKRVARKYGINKEMKGWEPVDITLFNGFSFRVHPKGVLVHIPEIVAEKPSVAAKIAFKRLVSILPKLERWLKLNPTALYKQGRLNIKLVSTHYALFEHEFAKWWVNINGQPREKFLVKADDGTLLLYLDNTPKNSIETSEPARGEMVSDSVQEFMKPVALGEYIRPDEAKARVEALESGVGKVGVLLENQLAPVLSEFSVQMEAHVGTAVAVHHGAESLDRAAVVLERVALAQEKSSSAQAQTVQVLVGELRAERLARRGGGFGWLRRVFSAGVVLVVGMVFLGWLW